VIKQSRLIIMLGAEVFLSEKLFDNEDIKRLCFSGNYLMVELQTMTAWSGKTTAMLDKLINDYGIIPVIAHAERYVRNNDAYKTMHSLVEKGCLIQMNADFLLWPLRLLMIDRMCREELVFLLGSDAHNTLFRPVRIKKAYETVKKHYPKVFEQVQAYSEKIMEQANLAMDYRK